MLNGPPILAPGGGAEVLPAGLLDSPDSLASSWFANSGFAPFHSVSRHHPSNTVSSEDSAHSLNGFGVQAYSSHQASTTSPSSFTSPSVDLYHHIALPHQVSLPTKYADIQSALIQPTQSLPIFSQSSLQQLSSHNTGPLPLTAPSSLPLSIYSTSGFDLLSILSRVANRPNPTICLGPVDLSCSFAIADVRRHDSPIVYASPSFYRLTGYSEHEVIGRNCRFLQSPTGHLARGEVRRSESSDAISNMRKALTSGKECQARLVNYKKGGTLFCNLVTVIPLRGGVHGTPEECDEIVYHVGFQADLTEQPGRILEKLREGSYCTSYSAWASSSIPPTPSQIAATAAAALLLPPRASKTAHLMSGAVSKNLRNLIADSTFTDAVPISTSTNISGTTAPDPGGTTTSLTALSSSGSGIPLLSTAPSSSSAIVAAASAAPPLPTAHLSPALSLLLLELLPDFLLVLSLKGSFLYVAPSVRLVLGYEPHELVGRSIADVCHPADLVPLMRELKEGSVGTGSVYAGSGGDSVHSQGVPKPVDLLFRAAPKTLTHPLPPFSFSPVLTSSSSLGSSSTSNANGSATGQASLDSQPESGTTEVDGVPRPHVWLECRGRLHVEPGKGRKAIILSGRARWMPAVRWSTVTRTGGVGVGITAQNVSPLGQGPKTEEPLEFWALLGPSGTFLIASASVRDVLGWSVSEVVGRSIWGMVVDDVHTSAALRTQVEQELLCLPEGEIAETDDPPPTILTSTIIHRDTHPVPVRIVFYRTPHAHTHPQTGGLANSQGSPLCPLVCQVSVLPLDMFTGMVSSVTSPSLGEAGTCVDGSMDPGSARTRSIRPGDATLFEELDTARGSSWQYELQQLKFANQRLHEELDALEGAGPGTASSSGVPMSNSEGGGVVSLPSSSDILIPGASPTPNRLHACGQVHHGHLHMNPHELNPTDWPSLLDTHRMSNRLKRTWNSDDRAA
ncbi:PAS domain-containing protein [Scleroderma citrinum]